MHIATPLVESSSLSAEGPCRVLFKLDLLQPSGSFKLRGIGRLATKLVREGAHALFASSGGNAGVAVAYAGRRLGVPVTVIVPTTTDEPMRAMIRAEGATVEVHGNVFDEAHVYAQKRAQAESGGYVHPFDHPEIWAGHSTIIDELADAGVHPSMIVLSVGGGGLYAGVVEGLIRHGWNDVAVLAVETTGAASFAASVRAGKVVALDRIDTIATTLGARSVATQALAYSKIHPTKVVEVSDAAAVAACVRLSDEHRFLVEPACGAALAAAYDRAPEYVAHLRAHLTGTVVIIVCGGVATSVELLAKWRTTKRAAA